MAVDAEGYGYRDHEEGLDRLLTDARVLGALSEVDLGRSLNAGCVVAVIDAVQVELQDLVFRVLRFKGGGDHRLAQLAQDRVLRGLQDGNLRQLLCDGSRAL